MGKKAFLNLAEKILERQVPDMKTYEEIVALPEQKVFDLFPGTDMIRNFYFGREIHLCTICNAKSGRCPEDCTFCSQSAFAKTDAPVYSLVPKRQMQEGAAFAAENPISRYSIVTSGKRLSKTEINTVVEAFGEMDNLKVSYCASLGTVDRSDLNVLKKAGVSRYHHNLETSESFFGQICTTHTYQERVETIKTAKEAGLSVCVGGLFGLGETDEQVLELALAIKNLDVDAVPINFLTPIKGTKLESSNFLTPLRCLKIIAIFRFVLPDKEILICGGRDGNLKDLHPLIFYAGASGIMTGDYLTTAGRSLEQDLQMLEDLHLSPRKKICV